ncbi:hypothetical protein [Streptomyces sp. NPDC058583]|uniref:hypothetical protein n=1 Tax=unclassified Streptomyces TaxID=2593676 RepID=UPI003657EBE2
MGVVALLGEGEGEVDAGVVDPAAALGTAERDLDEVVACDAVVERQTYAGSVVVREAREDALLR